MKIAIYSGSFNPIHNGHIAVAEAALDNGFDEVWLVVSPKNPHKNEEDLWPFNDRLKMAELAIANRSGLKVSDCENKLPRPSYTINTLNFLKKTYPENEFKLLIGGDNLLKFQSWKDHQHIVDEFGLMHIVVGDGNLEDEHLNYVAMEVANAGTPDERELLALLRSIPVDIRYELWGNWNKY